MLPRNFVAADRITSHQSLQHLHYPRSISGGGRRSSRVKAAGDRSIVILPGLGNNTGDYGPLAELLRKRDFIVEVANVSRPDW